MSSYLDFDLSLRFYHPKYRSIFLLSIRLLKLTRDITSSIHCDDDAKRHFSARFHDTFTPSKLQGYDRNLNRRQQRHARDCLARRICYTRDAHHFSHERRW